MKPSRSPVVKTSTTRDPVSSRLCFITVQESSILDIEGGNVGKPNTGDQKVGEEEEEQIIKKNVMVSNTTWHKV